jgi:hypothetical protein
VKFLRRLTQRFAQQSHLIGPDCYFAGFGLTELANGADYVADLQQLYKFPLLGEQFIAEAYLDRAAGVPQRNKNQFSNIPQEDDSAGTIGPLVWAVVFESGLYIRGLLGAIISVAVRINAQFSYPGQLNLPLLFKFIRSLVWLVFFCHIL